MLASLDAALARLRAGTAVGAERELTEVFTQPSAERLEAWVNRHPCRHPDLRGPDLEVVLAGDGWHARGQRRHGV